MQRIGKMNQILHLLGFIVRAGVFTMKDNILERNFTPTLTETLISPKSS